MSGTDSFRHVLKNSMGISYCLWYKNGLFMSMLESGNRWGPPFLLSDMATGDFSAVLDGEDSISTAFVDYSGRLLFIRACEEKKDPLVLLESRIVGSAPYNVCVLEAGEQYHVFYRVNHNRKQLLTYQKVEGTTFSMPEVIGIVMKDSKNDAVCTDGNSLHVFFITDIQDACLIVHRKISDGKAEKANSSPFPYKASKRLQALAAQDGIFYMLAAGDDGDPTVIFRFDAVGCRFSKGLEVFASHPGSGYDSLCLINGSPCVIRIVRNELTAARIKADATEVYEISKIDLSTRDTVQRCVYASNAKEDRGFSGYEIPMIFGNGLKFPFDWRNLWMHRPEKPADDKTPLNDRIKELEGRVAFLENTLREMLRP